MAKNLILLSLSLSLCIRSFFCSFLVLSFFFPFYTHSLSSHSFNTMLGPVYIHNAILSYNADYSQCLVHQWNAGISIENYARPICEKFYNIAFCSFILQLPWNIRKCVAAQCSIFYMPFYFFPLVFVDICIIILFSVRFIFCSVDFSSSSLVKLHPWRLFDSFRFDFISLLFIGALFCIHQIIYTPKCNDYNI